MIGTVAQTENPGIGGEISIVFHDSGDDFLHILRGGQERSANPHGDKRIPVSAEKMQHAVIFHPIDDVGGLNQKMGKSFFPKPIQGLLDGIDADAVPFL